MHDGLIVIRLRLSVLLVCATAACSAPPSHSDGGLDAPLDAAPDVSLDVSPDADLPPVLVGDDSIRFWDRMPYLRIGTRTVMLSTFDRAGGNEDADASHYIRHAGALAIPVDLAGPGVLLFSRANHWHGSPWHDIADGVDRVITESSTADPDHPVSDPTFSPADPFTAPFAIAWPTNMGADILTVPVPFEHTLTVGYERTHYGTGYFIVQRFAEHDDHLSHPIQSWNGGGPGSDVRDLFARAGTDIAPSGGSVTERTGTLAIAASTTVPITTLDDGPAMLRALTLSLPRDAALAQSDTHLRITFDDDATPAIDAPLALFFGAGTLYNRDGRTFLVKGLLTHIRFDTDRVELATYLPMPYRTRARIELAGASVAAADVRWSVRTVPYRDPPGFVGTLHATYRDHGVPVPGRDLVLLDTADEPDGPVCGTLVGTSIVFSDRAFLGTLEGDPRFFFDDSRTPQAQATGTEEWGGGGDYWGGVTTTLPLYGHPTGTADPASALAPPDLIESAYRFLLADAMPFGFRARIQLEHGGADDSVEHYRTVTFWYGRRGACLALSDEFDVGDATDELRHHYDSPTASPVQSLASRFEVGVDHAGATETVPTVTEDGRTMTGTTSFTVHLDPANVGAMLRRTLDLSVPDQRAEVWIADDRDDATYALAGVWYTAGSNRAVHSNPPHELDPIVDAVQTSSRQLRDDEFLVARTFTAGRAAVRIQIRFTPAVQAITPGAALEPAAWSELRYRAYSWLR